jgi:hypothetical protein
MMMMMKNSRPHFVAQNFALARTRSSPKTINNYDMCCQKDYLP